jgi:hypothetical protein
MATYPLRKTKYVIRQEFELDLNILDDGHVTINTTVISITANCLVISGTGTESIATIK